MDARGSNHRKFYFPRVPGSCLSLALFTPTSLETQTPWGLENARYSVMVIHLVQLSCAGYGAHARVPGEGHRPCLGSGEDFGNLSSGGLAMAGAVVTAENLQLLQSS